MKVFLRLVVIFLTLGILVYTLWPPQTEEPEIADTPQNASPTSEAADPSLSASQQAIKDLLGGAAIESGQKAKDIISEVNSDRQAEFDEMEM
ncbi:hypothetical protein P3T73_00400 [Kiritimatiellota bacterium B12222]|nr:hypothetical protein P3T73_00400 [Kiritimatiellota bacterium B12222]